MGEWDVGWHPTTNEPTVAVEMRSVYQTLEANLAPLNALAKVAAVADKAAADKAAAEKAPAEKASSSRGSPRHSKPQSRTPTKRASVGFGSVVRDHELGDDRAGWRLAPDDDQDEVSVGVVGWCLLFVYVLYLSGALPSPLYATAHRWPLWYGLTQAVVLFATLLQLQLHQLQLGNLHLGPHFLAMQKKVAAERSWSGLRQSIRALSLLEPLRAALYLGLSLGLLVATWAVEKQRGCRRPHSSMGPGSAAREQEQPLRTVEGGADGHERGNHFSDEGEEGDEICCKGGLALSASPAQCKACLRTVLRNMAAYGIVLLLDNVLTLLLDCGGLHVSAMLFDAQLNELADKWRTFHQPTFLFVRVSHAFTYLPLVICLSRRNMVDFARWRIFMLFVPDILADWAHYADSPVVAAARLDYENHALCAGIDRHFIRTVVSFPMNWVFLTTPLGVQQGS